MRTIKFRVWDNELKKYRSEKDGDYSLGVLSGKVRGIYGEKFPQMEVQQFTGLHDKNGKEIYEGDVIKPLKVLNATLRQVVFLKGGFWAYRNENDFYPIESYEGDSCEIIGNIFENPDLVKL